MNLIKQHYGDHTVVELIKRAIEDFKRIFMSIGKNYKQARKEYG